MPLTGTIDKPQLNLQKAGAVAASGADPQGLGRPFQETVMKPYSSHPLTSFRSNGLPLTAAAGYGFLHTSELIPAVAALAAR